MSTFEEIYRDTIHQTYYVASFILRDENLCTQVLKDAYRLAIRHMDLLEDADTDRQQDVMARIVSTKALELIRQKDPVSYQSFYEADLSDLKYIDEENLSKWDVKAHGDLSYKKAASRVATAVKLQAQPQAASAFLHYYIGMGTIEIAAAMDVEEDVVKAHLSASNRKLLKEAEDWKKQKRIPSDIDILPFLKWALEREKDRNHYAGPNLLEELRKERLQNQDPRLVTKQEQSAEVYKEKKKEEQAAKRKAFFGNREKPANHEADESDPADARENSEDKQPQGGSSEQKGIVIAVAAIIAAAVLIFAGFKAVTSYQSRESENQTEQASETETDTTEASQSDASSEASSDEETETDATGTDNSTSDTETEEDTSAGDETTEETAEDTETTEETAETVDPLDDPDAYIIPDSDSRYLTAEEVEAMDWTHLYYAINELYARRGRIFGTTNKVQKYFDSKTWYNGTIPASEWSDTIFNEYERANLRLMMKYNGNE